MNPLNTIANVVRKVVVAEIQSLVDDIAAEHGLDREELTRKFVFPRMDKFNLRRRNNASEPAKHPAPEVAVIHAREIEHNGTKYLLDVVNNIVYTNDLDDPQQVGEMLVDGSVLMTRSPDASSISVGARRPSAATP